MSRHPITRRFLAALSVLAVAGVLWKATAAENAPAEPQLAKAIADRLASTQTLGGDDRYLTHVSTDKPIYRPGETLHVRGVVLHHATHQPLKADAQQQASATIEIQGPKGDTVASGGVTPEDSVIGFQWAIPTGQAGGEYKIKISYPWQGYAPAERKFDIRAYRAPRLKSQIKFLRDGYGPGDEVAATLHVERAEGGIPAGANVTVIARVDGDEAFRGPATVDDKGNCLARFKLPIDIRRGEGTLAMVIEDGGVLETASKTIPILLQTVDLTMYPEGGELVAGLPNRVYFEAFTPAKKPADLAGIIVDEAGNEVAQFRSEHEGRGRFVVTPQVKGKYSLVIKEPAGIKTQYPLPEVEGTGVVLSTSQNVVAKSGDVALTVAAATAGKYTVTLLQRERLLASETLELAAGGKKDVTLKAAAADGVLIATVWDESGKPLAERLVFRQPSMSVNVKITADADRYIPGGKAKLTVESTDDEGKPISAVVGVTVTDDSVLEMIEKREQSPRLPVMVLLEDDVRELADAHVYLDPQNEQAPLAVDLLLGTQGWRRFALIETPKFIEQHGDASRRVLGLKLATVREREELFFEARGGGFPPPAPAAARPQQAAPANAIDGADAPKAGDDLKNDAPAKGTPVPDAAEQPAAPARELAALEAKPADVDGKDANRNKLQEALGKAEQAKAAAEPFFRDARRKQMAGRLAQNDFVAVRVYAHQVRADRQAGDRRDFAETLFWHAGVKTDEKGQASVEFGLNDSVTSFRVFADAFSDGGALGSASAQIESVQPFYLEPKLPLEVTAGDFVQAPIGIVNATGAAIDGATVKVDAHISQTAGVSSTTFALPADARLRKLLSVRVGNFNGPASFTITGTAGPYGDKVTRSMMVKPAGFPIQIARGGLIGPGDMVSHEITIPDNLVPNSLQARVVVYPTPLASMTEALESLIREPCGCFEQTSSSTYPLVMAQQYFMSHQGVDPSLIERSSLILETGYQRLIGFECKGGGYEWFGADPGHDALTAYGLLEFTDMSQVRFVDPAMLARTSKWLLGQRDGKGNYPRKTHTYHTWIAEPEIANAYNTWALLEAGVDADLSTEVKWIHDAAENTQNTYVMALAANVMSQAGDKEGEEHMLDKLAGKQAEDGSLSGATTSVVGSGGEALSIETTSLAVVAWLKNPAYAANVERSIKYLAESCKAGRFGSTQSTVLALRAIVAYDKSRAKPKAPGSLQLVVNDQPVGQPVEFTADTKGAIDLPPLAELLAPGKHKLQVQMTGGSPMPYSVAVNFNTLTPDSSEACKLHLEVKLRDKQIDEGAATEAEVVLINRTGETVPTPLAIIGIPGGLEVRHDQLKELVKSNKIAAYEVLGREVVLYWRALAAEERVELPLSLIAALPGTYTAPASRAYLYYTDEHKHWTEGLRVEITPRAENQQ
jgi:hypothetical protein